MVRQPPHRSFLSEESGISLTEGMLVIPIVLLAFAAFVEFGYAMFQWNQTVKAAQYGARLAAVSDPVANDFDPVAAAAAPSATDVGATIPIGGSWSCTGAACNSGLNRIVYGSAGATSCPALGAGVRLAMCHFNPTKIELANVSVTYELSGLGYYTRPAGAVVTIRLTVQGITFDSDSGDNDLPIIGTLLGIAQLAMPPIQVTITSEDLDTTPS
jgi:Flp pilus assembly protein TadG